MTKWCIGGARGYQTPDLLHAMQALSHLSYGPFYRVVITRGIEGVQAENVTCL